LDSQRTANECPACIDAKQVCQSLDTGPALSPPATKLVPVLLQNDTYQLTARPDSSLGKKLLSGFDGARGDPDPRCNFLVCETLEYK
jgi:hypothetical protein